MSTRKKKIVDGERGFGQTKRERENRVAYRERTTNAFTATVGATNDANCESLLVLALRFGRESKSDPPAQMPSLFNIETD